MPAKGIIRGVNDIQSLLQRSAESSEAPTPSGTLIDRSGTITAGGTAQQVMAANTTRQYLLFQNTSDTDMWINFGAVAVAASPSVKVTPGGDFEMERSFVSTQYVSVFCATTGKTFTAKEGQPS